MVEDMVVAATRNLDELQICGGCVMCDAPPFWCAELLQWFFCCCSEQVLVLRGLSALLREARVFTTVLKWWRGCCSDGGGSSVKDSQCKCALILPSVNGGAWRKQIWCRFRGRFMWKKMMVAARDEGARTSPLPPWFPCGEDDSRWWPQGVGIRIRLIGAVMVDDGSGSCRGWWCVAVRGWRWQICGGCRDCARCRDNGVTALLFSGKMVEKIEDGGVTATWTKKCGGRSWWRLGFEEN